MEPAIPPKFEPTEFLAKVGTGKTVAEYRKSQKVFSQGDPADAIFYIQKGAVKLSVVSRAGKEATLSVLGGGTSSARHVSPASRSVPELPRLSLTVRSCGSRRRTLFWFFTSSQV